jgi:hypothetical protein
MHAVQETDRCNRAAMGNRALPASHDGRGGVLCVPATSPLPRSLRWRTRSPRRANAAPAHRGPHQRCRRPRRPHRPAAPVSRRGLQAAGIHARWTTARSAPTPHARGPRSSTNSLTDRSGAGRKREADAGTGSAVPPDPRRRFLPSGDPRVLTNYDTGYSANQSPGAQPARLSWQPRRAAELGSNPPEVPVSGADGEGDERQRRGLKRSPSSRVSDRLQRRSVGHATIGYGF